jgi:hypothetical protein
MPQANQSVSFATDIKPMFRPIDIQHMQRGGVLLADYAYMSKPDNDHQNAMRVYKSLVGNPPTMPPGGPYWTQAQLDLLLAWIQGGCKP